MKTKNLILIFTISIFSVSCKKHGCTDEKALNYSDVAKKDDGSCFYLSDIPKEPAKQNVFIEEFTLTFGPSTAFGTYTPSFNKEDGDLIIMEVLSDATYIYWTALPAPIGTDVYLWGEYQDSAGDCFIYTQNENGNAAYLSSNATLLFKVALIKKHALRQYPNLSKLSIKELEQAI